MKPGTHPGDCRFAADRSVPAAAPLFLTKITKLTKGYKEGPFINEPLSLFGHSRAQSLFSW
jgi:hypothetical protein